METFPREMPETPDTRTADMLKAAAEREYVAADEMYTKVLGDLASRATSEGSEATYVFVDGVMVLASELREIRNG